MNEPTDINDKPNAPYLDVSSGEIEFGMLASHPAQLYIHRLVRIENVTFSYDGRTPALNGVSFKVPKNSSVALVGESGSGKSTILRLLYRFYDLEEGQGRILIDGQDIRYAYFSDSPCFFYVQTANRDVTQKSLRQSIGVVPQDSVLFNTSIKYNIGFVDLVNTHALPDISLDMVNSGLRMTRSKLQPGLLRCMTEYLASQMVRRTNACQTQILMPTQGYETTVGERGVRLSGGEKQRVAIARTLLKNPPILLLDEATSALDTSTEKDIQKALQNLMMGRSSLSIAHRLSVST